MSNYEICEQILVDLLDYYEVNEAAASECGDRLSVADYHDKAVILRSALNLVVAHHSYETGCPVVLPLCSREQQEQDC